MNLASARSAADFPKIRLITPNGNASFSNLNQVYTSLGLSYTLNLLYVTLFMGSSFFGFLLNGLTLVVLSTRSKFHLSLYFYLKASTLTCLCLNLFHVMFALVSSPQIVCLGNTYSAQFFISYIYMPVSSTLGYFKFILNTIMILERISVLRPRRVRFIYSSPSITVILGFVCAVVLMLPHYFVYVPYNLKLADSSTGLVTDLFITDMSTYARSLNGKILLKATAAFRGVAICFLDVVLSSLLVYYFKQFVNRKNTLKNSSKPAVSNAANRFYQEAATSGSQVFSGVSHHKELAVPLLERIRGLSRDNSSLNTPNRMKNQAESRMFGSEEKNVTQTVLFQCIFSVLHQILIFVTHGYVLLTGGVTDSGELIFFVSYVSAVRQAANFFIFYFFNNIFKQEVIIFLACAPTK